MPRVAGRSPSWPGRASSQVIRRHVRTWLLLIVALVLPMAGYLYVGSVIYDDLSVVKANCDGKWVGFTPAAFLRSEEHTSELQSHSDLVCRLLLEKKKNNRRHVL